MTTEACSHRRGHRFETGIAHQVSRSKRLTVRSAGDARETFLRAFVVPCRRRRVRGRVCSRVRSPPTTTHTQQADGRMFPGTQLADVLPVVFLGKLAEQTT